MSPSSGAGRPDGATFVTRCAAALLLVHAGLLAASIPRNAVTIDEVLHLPIGMSYWQRGEFWGYHHNPPLIRLLFALPAVLIDVPIDYSNFIYEPGNRGPDCRLGRDFMLLNQKHYMRVYTLCRLVVAALSVLGGYFVFRWSRELFGGAGALVSLALWTFGPNVLAHAGLVTPDVGSTVFGLIATYSFWKYLAKPSAWGAVLSGVLLGLTEAAKFSFVVLPFVWAALAAVKIFTQGRATTGTRLAWSAGAVHAGLLLLTAVVVLNDVYLFEGTGRPLWTFDFRSKALTGGRDAASGADSLSEVRQTNRFRGTLLEKLPMPFPEHYLLGFDDQMYDVDSGGYYKYLRGDLRQGQGWWYYYLYCILVKTPLGTLFLIALAAGAAVAVRRCRTDAVSECALALPVAVFLISISSQTGLNSHLRYVLPIVPFAFVFAGRLGRLLPAAPRFWKTVLLLALAGNAASVLRIHPHYLAYFNEVAGGPAHGLEHLADSNIDWGQGLIALRDWLRMHAPDQKIRLAYFGIMYPEVLGIDYELPPLDGPAPGLQAVSANYLLGIPFPAPNAGGGQSNVPLNALVYYRQFDPIAVPGYSIYVYDLSVDEVNRVRGEMGLPAWDENEPP
ncbi:MAG: ArnT family glycosyltransferase [Thermoguttaceae bacterium]